MASGQHHFFAPFRLDALNAQLWRGDQQITLRRKTFDVLLYLVDHPAQLVTKAALLEGRLGRSDGQRLDACDLCQRAT
jgi:DNA-binding response OmpR family regulator